jgi:hypothetical protein
MDKKIKIFIEKLKKMPDFNRVKFAFLFGSQINGNANKLSDYDFAVYYEGSKKERFNFRLKLLASLPDKFDIQIFQDLPLYVKITVFKKLIYAKDLDFVYDTAYSTIKEFESFKKYYYDYLNTRKIKT